MTRKKSPRSRTSLPGLDEQAVRQRLKDIIAKRFRDEKKRRVQLAIARVVKRAGIPWDTFYRKLKGDRRITAADVPLFARAFGLNPVWLATGQGDQGGDGAFFFALYYDAKTKTTEDLPDGHPLVLPDGLVTGRWVTPYREGVDPRTLDPLTGKPRRGRPPARPKLPFGSRVTPKRKRQAAQPARRLLDLHEIEQHLNAALKHRKLDLLNEFVSAELDQEEPRRSVLERLFQIAESMEQEVNERIRRRAAAEEETPIDLRLTNELTAALRNLDDAAAETPVRQPHVG